MEESYQDAPYPQPTPKTGLTGWQIALIVAAVVVVLCCLCLLAVLVLTPLLIGPELGNVFSSVIETVEAMTPTP